MRYEDMQTLLERMDVIKTKVSSNSIDIKDIDNAVNQIRGDMP